jgi:hypothetical protein
MRIDVNYLKSRLENRKRWRASTGATSSHNTTSEIDASSMG